MRRILLVVLCVVAVAYGQNRGSRRFTPSPFLVGQDLGFSPARRTTPRPGSGRPAARPRPAGWPGATRRRQTTPLPALGANDIDDGFGAVSAAKESTRRVPAVTAKRLPQRQLQRTRTSVRRRRPTRIQAVEVSVPEVTEKVIDTTQASVPTTVRPARLRTTSKESETSTLSVLQQQVEVLKEQARPTSRRRFKGRRVKKIRRIIHPNEDDDDETEEKELEKSEGAAESTATTTTQSPIVLRRQKKIFRGRGQQSGRGKGSGFRRQFSSRRRVVATAPPTPTEAAIADPTTVPTVSIITSSPFEPLPLEENELDNSESEDVTKPASQGVSGVTFTKVTSSAGGKSTGFSSSSSSALSSSSSSSGAKVTSSSQASSGAGLDGDSSANEVESSPAVNEVSSSEGTALSQGVRRPASRGSARGSSTFTRTRSRQGASRGSGRGRSRGSGRQRVTSSSSSSATSSSSSSSRGTSRRQFARRRRPSASAGVNAVTSRTPVTTTTTTTTTAATTTTDAAFVDIGKNPTTEQAFESGSVTSTNSLESEAPSRGQSPFVFGPTAGASFSAAAPVTTFGGFQPVTSSGSFRLRSGAATRFGVTPRPVSSTTFPSVASPTTPAVSSQFFGNRGFGQPTPVSTLLTNTIGDNDFRPTPAPEPVTFFSTGSRGAGSGRPNFGSFSFGTNSASSSSSSSSSGVSSFNRIPATARPVTFRPTTAKTTTTTSGFGSQRFGSQPVSASGGFRPSSFSTRHPAPTINTHTDNVRISSKGAFSFGTGLTSPPTSDAGFGVGSLRTTTPSSAIPTARPFTTSFGSGPTSTPARAPAVLTEAARFFGSQPNPTAQTTFGAVGSSRGSVSTFSHGSVHPAPGFSSGAFSFGTAVTEASTLVHSVATSPATSATTTTSPPQTFPPAPARPQTFHSATKRPVSHTAQPGDQTFVSHNQQQGSVQFQHQDSSGRTRLQESSRAQQQHSVQKPSSFSSSLSSSSHSSSDSGRSASSGRSFGSTSSSNSFFGTGRVTGFEFQQENGIITRSSHLRGFDTRLPTFHENVVISDPVFSSKDIKPGFTCEGKPYGYYADEANDCKIFHICQPVDVSSISTFYTRYSFFCGSETRFDQSKLSCLHDKDAMPCSESPSWLFRNDEFGVQEERSAEERFQEEVHGAAVTV